MLNDKCNDAYGLIYAAAMGASPLIGSSLHKKFGPNSTCDIIGFTNLGFAIILFLFNCGPSVFSENKVFLGKLAKLQAAAAGE